MYEQVVLRWQQSWSCKRGNRPKRKISLFSYFLLSLTCFSFLPSHFRCAWWIQWDYLCLWADFLWKDTYDGGTVILNHWKGRPLAGAHTSAQTHTFCLKNGLSPPLLFLTVHLPPSLSLCSISLPQPSVGTNLLYNSLWETTLFLFKSKVSLLSLLLLFSLLNSTQGLHLSTSSVTCSYLSSFLS